MSRVQTRAELLSGVGGSVLVGKKQKRKNRVLLTNHFKFSIVDFPISRY